MARCGTIIAIYDWISFAETVSRKVKGEIKKQKTKNFRDCSYYLATTGFKSCSLNDLTWHHALEPRTENECPYAELDTTNTQFNLIFLTLFKIFYSPNNSVRYNRKNHKPKRVLNYHVSKFKGETSMKTPELLSVLNILLNFKNSEFSPLKFQLL